MIAHTGSTVVSCNFNNCFAGTYGGAISISAGLVTVEKSTFTNNNATTNGGAIYWSGSTGNASNNVFTNNHATGQSNDIYNAIEELIITNNRFVGSYIDISDSIAQGYNRTNALKVTAPNKNITATVSITGSKTENCNKIATRLQLIATKLQLDCNSYKI